MDYLRGYRVFRDDPEWSSKLLVGSLLALSAAVIPFFGQIVLTGWQALILRRAVRGQHAPLPRLDWDTDHLGKLVGIGFKGFVVRFLWTLPIGLLGGALLMCIGLGLAIATAGAAGGGEPELGALLPCCFGLAFLLLIPLLALASVPAQVAAMRAELADDLQQGLRPREVWAMLRALPREILFGTLVLWLVGAGLGAVGLLACYVGVFPMIVLGMVAQAHWMAQVYARWIELGGEALPVGPAEASAPDAAGARASSASSLQR